MYLIPILLHPVLCLRYDKRNGVVVIELATTEFWLKSSKPLQILDQSRTINSRRSQMPFGYSIPLTMVRLRTSNVHSWTEFLSLIAELRAKRARGVIVIVGNSNSNSNSKLPSNSLVDIPRLRLFFRPISKSVNTVSTIC